MPEREEARCHRPQESCNGPGCTDFKSLAKEHADLQRELEYWKSSCARQADISRDLQRDLAQAREDADQQSRFHMLWKAKAEDLRAALAELRALFIWKDGDPYYETDNGIPQMIPRNIRLKIKAIARAEAQADQELKDGA